MRGDRRTTVAWDDPAHTLNSEYVVERRTGTGPYEECRPLGEIDGFFGHGVRMTDVLPAFGLPVRYRVAASSIGAWSPWSYSPTITAPEPTLQVAQQSGRIHADPSGYGDIRIAIVGRLAAKDDGTSLPDPTHADFELVFGDPGRPVRVVTPQGRGVWTREGRVVRLAVTFGDDAVRSVDFSWDEGNGSFRAAAVLDQDALATLLFAPRASQQVEIGVALGGLAGGDLRTWRRVEGDDPGFELR
jgi:hypothetical protein